MPGSYSTLEEIRLAEMWTAGYSADVIGKELAGRTGNTICGKAFRMGLKPRPRTPSVPKEWVTFDELDTVRLPLEQRRALALLLDAHPFGLTHKQIGERLYGNDPMVIDPVGKASRLIVSLDETLTHAGWHASTTGDRKGVKLHPVKGVAE